MGAVARPAAGAWTGRAGRFGPVEPAWPSRTPDIGCLGSYGIWQPSCFNATWNALRRPLLGPKRRRAYWAQAALTARETQRLLAQRRIRSEIKIVHAA